MPDVSAAAPTSTAVAPTSRMLVRGLVRHCPRCGAGHLFTRWFTLAERCPECRYLFAREEGFFLGAFVMNFAVTIAGLGLFMAVLIAALANNASRATVAVVAVAAGTEALFVPVLFYPVSKTLWAAVDLAMHRNETWAAAGGGDAPSY